MGVGGRLQAEYSKVGGLRGEKEEIRWRLGMVGEGEEQGNTGEVKSFWTEHESEVGL